MSEAETNRVPLVDHARGSDPRASGGLCRHDQGAAHLAALGPLHDELIADLCRRATWAAARRYSGFGSGRIDAGTRAAGTQPGARPWHLTPTIGVPMRG